MEIIRQGILFFVRMVSVKMWKKFVLILVFVNFLSNVNCSESQFTWDFTDCEIQDVLFAISLDTGLAIVADDTVSGKCSLKFAGKDFEQAFDAFLNGNRMYVEKNDSLWTVSKFRFVENDGRFSLDAVDMQPAVILEKVSKKIDSAITCDVISGGKLSLHLKNLTEKELLLKLAKSFGGFEVVFKENDVHFLRKTENRRTDFSEGQVKIVESEAGFEVDVKEAKFITVLERLFEADGKESENFCFLGNGDVKIQRCFFKGVKFFDVLNTLCLQNGFSVFLNEGTYYILNDSEARSTLFYGKREWIRFDLKYTKPENFIPLIGKQLGKVESYVLPNGNSFSAYVNAEEKSVIKKLIDSEDEKISTFAINLKYIKPEEFLKHLSPSINRDALVIAEDNSCLYFTGTEDSFKSLVAELDLCDKPAKRITYDLLILQYDESSQNSWSPGVSVNRHQFGDRSGISAQLGNVFNLNLNVVSVFGLSFAASLQSSIEENKTKVFADTTLHGVSGKPISFKNTNVYRYRDNNLDPETGKPIYSGVTREIISGIKLDVVGWVSGDGMITSTVTASVSRQGVDNSAYTGNPPATTEKTVTTEVRGKSGEPVVLSGLIQNADSDDVKRTPLLSKLPVIRHFFRSKVKIKENSQMVIYLVPHLENENIHFENKKNMNEKYSDEWAESRINQIVRR